MTSTAAAAGSARPRRRPALGDVALAAAGPGDPALVTVRVAALLAQAEVVITDPQVLHIASTYATEGVEVVPTVDADGVELARPARTKLVIEAAKAGRRAVRLLAGDPEIDGTLAAESAELAKAKVPFEVAPGVSTVTGVPVYAGLTLGTPKNHEVRVVTYGDTTVAWDSLAQTTGTLVVRNGADHAVDIAKHLMTAGRSGETPIAITSRGTTVDQRTVVATLETCAAAVKAHKLSEPGLVVIGDAVAQRGRMDWFEAKPLFGWHVLVPRTQDRGDDALTLLRRHGAVPVEVPTISVEPPRTPHQIDRAITGLVQGRYEWVIFTSVNAVRAVKEKLDGYGLDARSFAGLKVAAVGRDTEAALIAFGVRPDLMPPTEQTTHALLDEWPVYDTMADPINRVFLPRADIATETLVAGLTELGWEVEDITAYRTVRAAPPPADTREAIKSGGFDAVVFTSSSTVRNLVGIAGKPHAATVVACIGPQTAKTAEEHGLRVDVLSDEPDVMHLVEALAAHGDALRIASIEAGESTWRPSARRAGARRKVT